MRIHKHGRFYAKDMQEYITTCPICDCEVILYGDELMRTNRVLVSKPCPECGHPLDIKDLRPYVEEEKSNDKSNYTWTL